MQQTLQMSWAQGVQSCQEIHKSSWTLEVMDMCLLLLASCVHRCSVSTNPSSQCQVTVASLRGWGGTNSKLALPDYLIFLLLEELQQSGSTLGLCQSAPLSSISFWPYNWLPMTVRYCLQRASILGYFSLSSMVAFCAGRPRGLDSF